MKNRISSLILIAGLAGCVSKNPVPSELKAPIKSVKSAPKKALKSVAPKAEPKAVKKPHNPASV